MEEKYDFSNLMLMSAIIASDQSHNDSPLFKRSAAGRSEVSGSLDGFKLNLISCSYC